RRSLAKNVGADNTTSPSNATEPSPVILGDTMGELRKFYSLATIVFVGRSLVDLGPRQHGSDMIEPAALAKPTIVGPYTSNFADAVTKFKAADAIMQVDSEASLEQAMAVLLSTPKEAIAMGVRAAQIVHREQGATGRHAHAIMQIVARQLGEEYTVRPAAPVE